MTARKKKTPPKLKDSSPPNKDMPQDPRELAAAMFRVSDKGMKYNADRQNRKG